MFWIVDRSYGFSNGLSFPSASFAANIDLLNSSGEKFLILTGDIFQSPQKSYFENFFNYFTLT